jgi:hypothetical protein
MKSLLGGGLRFLKTTLFDNSRKENLGITQKDKEKSSASIKSAGTQYDITNTYAAVTDMTVTHESKTGRVLVIFSGKFSLLGDDGFGDEVRIKLQKDGVDVPAAERFLASLPDGGIGETIIGFMPGDIITIDTNAAKNTWRVLAKATTTGNSFIDDRNLIVIDI